MEQADKVNEHAAALEEAGTEARHTAEYVRATVLFALVLFLVAVGQRFRLQGVRIATIALAAEAVRLRPLQRRHPAAALRRRWANQMSLRTSWSSSRR
jgi:hypothetical protein